MKKELKTPSLLDALIPIVSLVIMMGSAVFLFEDDSSYGPNQIALLLAMGLAAIIGMKNGHTWKAIEKGIPKLRIEEAAAKKQARIDSGQDVIVGVNKYRLAAEEQLQTLEVDNEQVRRSQIERLNAIKASRNSEKADAALKALTEGAKNNKNLLELAVEAARERATLGEISDALEEVFGRHKAEVRSFSGVYSKEVKDDKSFQKARELANKFAELDGRRPRIMIAKMGQDGHDRGAKVIATAFADLGFDVDIAPLFQTPEEAARQAIENDVHVIGISSQAAGHKTLIELLMKVLQKENSEDIVVVAGGVIPPHDYAFLKDLGVACIFGPGTPIPGAAREVLAAISNKI